MVRARFDTSLKELGSVQANTVSSHMPITSAEEKVRAIDASPA
jgi:hypothetical protein